MIKQLSRSVKYEDAWLKLFQDEVEFPSGQKGTYAVLERKNGAGIILYTPEHEIVLTRQYRYPIAKEEWNIPGGGIDHGEDAAIAATREVEEETGLVIKNPVKLGEFYPLSSCSTEKVTLFMAEVEKKILTTSTQSDEEIVQVQFFPMSEALAMIDRGDITDVNTCNAIQMLERRLR